MAEMKQVILQNAFFISHHLLNINYIQYGIRVV
jgi:hypothetical protein